MTDKSLVLWFKETGSRDNFLWFNIDLLIMKSSYLDFFKKKKITLMGLGLLGRGVGDAAFLAKCGAKLTVTDLKNEKDLAKSIAMLRKFPAIRFVLGGHEVRDFKGADMVIKAAGVPLDSLFIKEARKHKVSVEMSTSLFVKLLPKEVIVIGVTGTRGKTTTTNLIYSIIQTAGKRAHLGGNIKGVSTVALLPKVRFGDYVVLELDSWQLQGFGDAKISPHVAVFTTFLHDHLNYYGTMSRYFNDKANIFKNQKSGNNNQAFIVGEQVLPFIKKYYPAHARRAIVAPCVIPRGWKTRIPGEHNKQNIAYAIAVADILNIPRNITKKAVESFKGVTGRLELIREKNGVKIYNDTTATTPDATIAALRALGSEKHKNIILIIGGTDKGLDMSALPREIIKYCKSVIFLVGTGTDKFLISNFQFLNKFKIQEAKTLKEAVQHAITLAGKNDTVLFSPAFTSFGMFKNEYDRGEKFVKLISNLE